MKTFSRQIDLHVGIWLLRVMLTSQNKRNHELMCVLLVCMQKMGISGSVDRNSNGSVVGIDVAPLVQLNGP